MKILIKTVAGSHLFGTNTETSDKDFKGVFLPSATDILLLNKQESFSQSSGDDRSKNTKDDVDVEFYSLSKFFKMLKYGDTAAIELLFTPEEFILEKDELWDVILKERDLLVSSKITGVIGYARQQANKYGIKGSRMGELNNFISFLKTKEKDFDFANPKLKHGWDDILKEIKTYQHIELIDLPSGDKVFPALDVLGKKFDHNVTFPQILTTLKKIYKNYGQRAREAKNNNGIDWKALSHAVRVMLQGIELLNNGNISLPHMGKNRDLIMDIKKGSLSYDKVAVTIEELLEKLEEAKKTSSLREEPDSKLMDSLLIDLHMNQLKEFMKGK